MNFMILDIALLVLFVIVISLFLYKNRKNLKKEGLLLLYKTHHGISAINKVGNKYKKTLKFLSYVCIGLGYLLMAGILYLFGRIVWIYASRPDIVTAVKVPPIMPLVPYIPQIFKLTFLPPFYFIYWIIIIAIIAIPHEFAHGIFAAYNKIKIKKTGFGFFPFFLPVFLAAFVELDEKKMAKKSKFAQMSVLSAGTFANVLTAIFFFGIMVLFFTLVFTPSGVIFNSYAYSVVNVSDITMINGISLDNPNMEEISSLIEDNETFNDIRVDSDKYVGVKEISKDYKRVALFYDAPAIKAGLEATITKIDGVKIENISQLDYKLSKKSPGDKVMISTQTEEGAKEYEITLEENPGIKGRAWLGIEFPNIENSGILNKVVNYLFAFKKPNVYYESKIGVGLFIYNLLWWLVLISFSVALINMLPVGLFDGGRFFYLTILAITKKEKIAKKTFSIVTYLFLFLVLLLMVFWVFSLIK